MRMRLSRVGGAALGRVTRASSLFPVIPLRALSGPRTAKPHPGLTTSYSVCCPAPARRGEGTAPDSSWGFGGCLRLKRAQSISFVINRKLRPRRSRR